MSKKFFAAAAIAALMCAGGYFAKSATTPNDGLSDLELANAEALADGPEWEITIPFHVGCFTGDFGCLLHDGVLQRDKSGLYADGSVDTEPIY